MNQLQHIDEFRHVLEHYRLSDEAKLTLKDLRLVLMVGPTSSGRNTIIRELVKTGRYHFIVSDTTRKPRINDGTLEESGREYWFRTEEDMLEELKKGQFLEAAIIHNQQVSGMSIRELEIARKTNKIAIDEVEIAGAGNTYIAKPDTIIIFSVPPGFDVWMKRLQGRGKMPEDEVRRRLESACDEFEAALTHDYYHFVVNDDIAETVATIDAMAEHGESHRDEEYKARELVKDLYRQTKDYLLVTS
jgi:guanylate kinase